MFKVIPFTKINGLKTNMVLEKGKTFTSAEPFSVSVITQAHPIPEILDNVIAIAMGYTHAVAICKNDHVYVIGNNFKGQLGIGDTVQANGWLCTKLKAKSIKVGILYSIAIDLEDNIHFTGDNTKGVFPELPYEVIRNWSLTQNQLSKEMC